MRRTGLGLLFEDAGLETQARNLPRMLDTASYLPLRPKALPLHPLLPDCLWTCLKLRGDHVCAKLLQSCPTLCNSMDCSPPGSSVHGILQAKYRSGLPRPPPGDLPEPGIKPRSPVLAGGFWFFTTGITWEAHGVYHEVTMVLLYYKLFWFSSSDLISTRLLNEISLSTYGCQGGSYNVFYELVSEVTHITSSTFDSFQVSLDPAHTKRGSTLGREECQEICEYVLESPCYPST